MHGFGLVSRDADGDEALPVSAADGSAGAQVIENAGGNADLVENGLGPDVGLVNGGRLRNERH